MNVDEFWTVIDKVDRDALGAGDDDAAVAPVIDALAGQPRRTVAGFEDHLAAALYALDGQTFADASGESGESDDAFLYTRCFVVASGRKAYEQTLADPQLMPKKEDNWCEPLLFAAAQAWERDHDDEWDHIPKLDYETGSNRKQW